MWEPVKSYFSVLHSPVGLADVEPHWFSKLHVLGDCLSGTGLKCGV